MRRRLSLRPPRVSTVSDLTVIDKKPGAPPGKDDKGKKPGEEVISPEEKERQEKESAAREERQAAFAKWWEEQSEQERFQLYCEDKFREARLIFPPQGSTSMNSPSPD